MLNDDGGRAAQIGRLIGDPQVIALSSTSAVSTALKPNTAYRLYSTVACFIKFGPSNVVATGNSNPLNAGSPEVFATDDTNIYVAGILASSTANLFVSELGL